MLQQSDDVILSNDHKIIYFPPRGLLVKNKSIYRHRGYVNLMTDDLVLYSNKIMFAFRWITISAHVFQRVVRRIETRYLELDHYQVKSCHIRQCYECCNTIVRVQYKHKLREYSYINPSVFNCSHY